MGSVFALSLIYVLDNQTNLRTPNNIVSYVSTVLFINIFTSFDNKVKKQLVTHWLTWWSVAVCQWYSMSHCSV